MDNNLCCQISSNKLALNIRRSQNGKKLDSNIRTQFNSGLHLDLYISNLRAKIANTTHTHTQNNLTLGTTTIWDNPTHMGATWSYPTSFENDQIGLNFNLYTIQVNPTRFDPT